MNKRSKLTVGILTGVIFGMLGLSLLAAPLYSEFCKVTGFGGTTRVATEKPKEMLDRVVRVAFDANVAKNAPLKFHALQANVDVKLGETMMAFYEVTNLSNAPVRAAASFNVTPYKVGRYFEKLECFCFQEHTYEPGKTVKLPVVFFVSPDMAKDWQADDVRGLTLSYTYYRVTGDKVVAQLENVPAVN